MHPHHAPDHPHPAGAIHPHDGRGGRPRGGWSLAAIVGLNPCALVIPYLYLAGEAGTAALLVTAGAFALSTVTCMVGVVILGLRGTARLESPFLMRYGEAVSGGLIAATGLAAIFFGG